jgi:hypothetical protein
MRKRSIFLLVALIVFVLVSAANALRVHGVDPSVLLCTCDVNGNGQFVFRTNENIYVKGAYFSVDREVTIYIIPNRNYPITPEIAIAGPVKQTITNRLLPITLVWHAPLKEGTYDIWVDVDQDGIYDNFGDRYFFFCCNYEFLVVPEYLIGALGSLTAMAASLTLFYKTRNMGKTK